MAAETIFTAARRAVRFFNMDMNKGGLMTVETMQAIDTLDKMLRADPRWGRAEEQAEAAEAAAEEKK